MEPQIIFTKLNAELFQFLAKSLPNRTSRFEAFLYLYKCQTDSPDHLLNYNISIPFNATYDMLAERWKWDRKTVMAFLKSLHTMGILEVKRESCNITIHILNLAYVPSETSKDIEGDST